MSDSALGYDFPYALDNATKDAAADKIREARNQSLLGSLINPRDKEENEQTYQDALGLLRVNAVNESNAKIGDTILLASGVGEIAVAAKAAPVFLKGFFSTTGKTLTEKSSSLVSATRQGAAKAESRATENTSVLDDTTETVVSSSSQNAVGNATTTQVGNGVTKSGPKLLPPPRTASQTFKDMGSFEGMTVSQITKVLKQNGFRFGGKTEGGYIQFFGKGTRNNRMEVHIRPNGQVVRLEKLGKSHTRRLDSSGNVTQNHQGGEFAGGNFIGP